MAPLQLPASGTEPQVSVSCGAERPLADTWTLDQPVGRGEPAAAELLPLPGCQRPQKRTFAFVSLLANLSLARAEPGREHLNKSFPGPPIVLFKATLKPSEHDWPKTHS